MSGSNWLALCMLILGALWAIPAWYFGKAAGMKYARHNRRKP